MSGSLGSDHGNINVLGRYDTSEMNIETMCKHKHVAFLKVWLDVFLIHICLKLIIDQDHNDVCLFCRLCCCEHF